MAADHRPVFSAGTESHTRPKAVPAIGRRAASPLLRRRSGRLRAPSRGELNPRLNTAAHTPSTSKCVAMPFAALSSHTRFRRAPRVAEGPPSCRKNMAGGRAGACPLAGGREGALCAPATRRGAHRGPGRLLVDRRGSAGTRSPCRARGSGKPSGWAGRERRAASSAAAGQRLSAIRGVASEHTRRAAGDRIGVRTCG